MGAKAIFLPPPNTTRIGVIEISRLQDITHQNMSKVLDTIVMKQIGLAITVNADGSLPGDWAISSGSGNLTIAAGKALIKDGDGLTVGIALSTPTNFDLSSLADGTYNVFLRYASSTIEAGTIAVTNGDTSVSGSGTFFTQVLEKGRKIIIGSNSYQVDTISDDETLTLTSAFPDTSNAAAQYSVGGMFASDPSVVDQHLYQYDIVAVMVTTAASLDGDIVLGQVIIAGHVATEIMDKRISNRLTLIQEGESLKSIILVTQVNITATTLTDVTGLAVQLEAGKSYRIKAALLCDEAADILGWKVGASYGGGTIGAVMSARSFTIPGIFAVNVSHSIGTILDASTVNVSPTKIEIDGIVETISANTLTIQLAETTGSHEPFTVYGGSTLEAFEL